MKKEIKRTTIRVPEHLIEAIKAIALENNRSFNNMVEVMLTKAVKEAGK